MPSPSVSPIMTQHMSHRSAQPVPNVLDLASRFQDADLLIPQKIYRPNTQSDRRRYVEEVALEQPIMFYLQHPEGCGISCKEAMNSRFSRLVDRDDAMFINRGPSVSIRINVRDLAALLFISMLTLFPVARVPSVESSDPHEGFP